MATGIYMIRNVHSEKCYIGSSSYNIQARWNAHKHDLRKQKHRNKHLQRAWDKYGEEAFEFRILMECAPEDCLAAEQVWMNVFEPEYNAVKIAGGPRGYKHTAEAKAKISATHKGRIPPNKGKKASQETREKISLANRGEKNWNFGKKASPETRARLSESHKGKKQSPETIALRSARMKEVWARKRAAKAAA